jgi:hypothetical protein
VIWLLIVLVMSNGTHILGAIPYDMFLPAHPEEQKELKLNNILFVCNVM